MKYQYFCRFELENMSIYEILPALDLTQSVHAKISIVMHRGVKFKISRIPLIGLETRLGCFCYVIASFIMLKIMQVDEEQIENFFGILISTRLT
jgi:hypothetical protein